MLFHYIFSINYIFKHLLSAEDTVLMLKFLGQKIFIFRVCYIWPNCSGES